MLDYSSYSKYYSLHPVKSDIPRNYMATKVSVEWHCYPPKMGLCVMSRNGCHGAHTNRHTLFATNYTSHGIIFKSYNDNFKGMEERREWLKYIKL
jgi:hypothetical protein